MKKKLSSLISVFLTRAFVGIALIIVINLFLSYKGIPYKVGVNPWTVGTAGVLGAPGVALIYGIVFYKGLF